MAPPPSKLFDMLFLPLAKAVKPRIHQILLAIVTFATRLEPILLAIATFAYGIQSKFLRIPDRYAPFSNGPKSVQIREAARFVAVGTYVIVNLLYMGCVVLMLRASEYVTMKAVTMLVLASIVLLVIAIAAMIVASKRQELPGRKEVSSMKEEYISI